MADTENAPPAGRAPRRRVQAIAAILAVLILAAVVVVSTTGGSHPQSLAIHVRDGRLVDASGNPTRLLGVGASGTEYACVNNGTLSPTALDGAEAGAMRGWHMNAVRVPLNEDCWLGINGVAANASGARYQAAIERWVSALNRAGIIAILDLHWSAPGRHLANEQWPMADEDHSVSFWSQVARRFRSDPRVVFDLFNEPFLGGDDPSASDWSCWLRGCEVSFDVDAGASVVPVTYRSAGMQQLVSTVRATGARQLIVLGGLNYSNDPCTAWSAGEIGGTCTQLVRMPHDPRGQLALSMHVYSWNACTTVRCWDSIAALAHAAALPIVTTEIGEDDCSDGFINAYMDWADQHDMSYLAWTWTVNQHAACVPGLSDVGADLSLLQSANGTPSSVSPEAADFRAHLIADQP